LSIIIPAWNEGKIVYDNLQQAEDVFNQLFYNLGFNYEIILVDDGSIDNTYNQALMASKKNGQIKVIHKEKNGGKGSALKYGFKVCSGKFVAFIDADLDLHPKQIPLFIDHMEKYDADVTIGSKRHPLSKVNYPFSRQVLSQAYHILTRILFRLNLSDTQAGLKLFKYEVLEDILPTVLCKKYAFDLELLVSANHRGHEISEIPIELNWQRSKNRLTIRDIWYILLDTLAIFYRFKIVKQYNSVKNEDLDFQLARY